VSTDLCREADHGQGTAPRRERRGPDGRVAPEHRPKVVVAGETSQEATQGGERPEGNADADSGQEAGEETAAKKTASKPQRKSA
jgi:hypothetical protein